MPALVRDAVLRPELAEDADRLVGAAAALVHRHAARLELGRELAADADPEQQPAAREHVERRDDLGGRRRVAERQEIDAAPDLHALGRAGDERRAASATRGSARRRRCDRRPRSSRSRRPRSARARRSTPSRCCEVMTAPHSMRVVQDQGIGHGERCATERAGMQGASCVDGAPCRRSPATRTSHDALDDFERRELTLPRPDPAACTSPAAARR